VCVKIGFEIVAAVAAAAVSAAADVASPPAAGHVQAGGAGSARRAPGATALARWHPTVRDPP
jgi:hypothetical protein